MVYFCADDYGISRYSNNRIEQCLKGNVLNKISILPNGENTDFKQRLREGNLTLSLHLNLVEGKPLSKMEDVDLIVRQDGTFKYSFIGLFLASFSPKRKRIEEQVYGEIRQQIAFWQAKIGDDVPLFIDSHQHTHMIPFVFRSLMRAIRDSKITVDFLRMPCEPILPYLLTPSLYFSYSLSGLMKHWLLNALWLCNRREFQQSRIKTARFLGAMFSGKVDEKKLKKILPQYLKYAKTKELDIEVGLHPGYLESADSLIDGSRKGFEHFYRSPWRKREYDTLINFKFQI